MNFSISNIIFFEKLYDMINKIRVIKAINIITPKEIIAYNQSWIFSRSSRAIDVDKIKTITVDKKWFFQSSFNFWSLVFLSEWDESGHGDIKLDFVYNPDNIRKKIIDIVEFWEGE